MGQLSVKSIRVRAYVGTDSVVENNSVDLQMNISVHYNSIIEEESDNPDDAFPIHELIQEIQGRAENSHFNLIEAFARMVLDTIFEFDRIDAAKVEVTGFSVPHTHGNLSFSLSGSKG